MTDTYLPARIYGALVNDLALALSHDHDSAEARQAAIAAALATAGFTSPALVQTVAAAEPCAFSGEYDPRDVRMILGEIGVWHESYAQASDDRTTVLFAKGLKLQGNTEFRHEPS